MSGFSCKLATAALVLKIAPYIAAQGFPDPIQCIGTACFNKLGELAYQDMTVIRRESDDTYFRFSKGTNLGDGLNVATAPALRGPWEDAYTILGGATNSVTCTDPSGTWRWAPEVHFINGKYFLYYGLNCPDFAFDQVVAVSSTMDEDDWTDYGSMGVPMAPEENASYYSTDARQIYVRLDGNLLANSSDPSGIADTQYMVLGSYQFGLYGFPLSSDMRSIASPSTTPVEIIADQYTDPSPARQQSADPSGNYTEGGYQLIHNDYIYLFYSRGDCCAPPTFPVDSIYQTQVCRAALTDGPTGPYYHRDGENCITGDYYRTGTTVLKTNSAGTVWAPGSVGVLNDPLEGLVLFYQCKSMPTFDL